MERQRRLHQFLGWIFVTLLFTGTLLHVESLRGTIADWRAALRGVHLLAGVLFIAIFVINAPFFWTFRLGKKEGLNRQGYVWFLLLIGAVWVVTGTGMGLATFLGWGGSLANQLYLAHVLIAVIGTISVLPHILYALANRAREGYITEAADTASSKAGRRKFLRYLWGGLLAGGTFIVWKWLGQQVASIKSETVDVFAQCNKMLPKPAPLPDSSPPRGGGYTGKFRVYKIDPQIPCATSADWQFNVGGLVDKPMIYRWEDFLKLPRVVQISDFHCVEGWSVFRITYEGVRLSDFLDLVGVASQARYVKFYSAEGVYTDTLSLEQARLPDVMAAVLLDGREIPSDLGGPVRLVIPQMFAYKAVKWLVGMELIDAPQKGYWEARGYPVDAWVRPGK